MLIAALGLICIWNARADSLVSSDIEYRHFLGPNRFLEAPGKDVANGLAIDIDIQPIAPIYWDNQVHMLADAKPIWVGWHFEAGVRLSKLDVYFSHHSQHALDWVGPFWPVDDSVGFRWRLYP